MDVLVTGAAGFIGFHLARRLLEAGRRVIGVDALTAYYDPALKQQRLTRLRPFAAFSFEPIDVRDADAVDALVKRERPQRIVHLAAEVGVRASSRTPREVVATNVLGTTHVLEAAVRHGVGGVVIASSSSVYGDGAELPQRESTPTGAPLSLYAASKIAAEQVAQAFCHLHPLPITLLRLFTVYGPFGRPDMAPLRFAQALLAGEPIRLHDGGRMRRDFTYVEDVVEAMVRVLEANAPGCHVYNVARGEPITVDRFLGLLEEELGRQAQRHEVPADPAEMHDTWGDSEALNAAVGYRPATPVEEGVRAFARWLMSEDGAPWRQAPTSRDAPA